MPALYLIWHHLSTADHPSDLESAPDAQVSLNSTLVSLSLIKDLWLVLDSLVKTSRTGRPWSSLTWIGLCHLS